MEVESERERERIRITEAGNPGNGGLVSLATPLGRSRKVGEKNPCVEQSSAQQKTMQGLLLRSERSAMLP